MCCCSSHESGAAIVKAASEWANSRGDRITWSMKLFLCGGSTYRGKIVDIEEQYFTFETNSGYRESTRYDIPFSCVERIRRYESSE